MNIQCNECKSPLSEPVNGWAVCQSCGRKWQIEGGAIKSVDLIVHKIINMTGVNYNGKVSE